MIGSNPILTKEEKAAIRKFHVGMVGRETIGTFLHKGFSLVICCKECPRVVEWTPPEMAQKFEGRLDLRIADIVPKLACVGEGGCGSREVAVGPHLYEPAAKGLDG